MSSALAAICLLSCTPNEDPTQLSALGKRLMEEKQYARAIAPLKRAWALRTSDIALGITLAEALLQEERHDEAIETCRRIESFQSQAADRSQAESIKNRSKAAFLAARALRELGRLREAEQEALRSLSLLPRNAAGRALLGGILAQQARHSEAAPQLEEALATMTAMSVEHGMEQLHYQLGQSLVVLGRTQEAARHFQRHRELRRQDDLRRVAGQAREYTALAAEAAKRLPPAPPKPASELASSAERSKSDAFVDVAREVGIDWQHDSGARGALHPFETVGGGAAWLDYDLDGDPDLYLVSGQAQNADGTWPQVGKNALYRNDAGRFTDATAEAGVPGHGYGLGATVGDVDNDGDPDLYVLCFGPNILYRNRGNGSFEEVKPSGAEGSEPLSGGAAFGDFNADGILDLFLSAYFAYEPQAPPKCFERELATGKPLAIYCGPVSYRGAANQLFQGLGNGQFRDVSRAAGIGSGQDAQSKSLGVLACDFDDDGDLDAFVACDTTANLLYRNRGNGSFEEIGLEAGVAVTDTGLYEGSMGVAVADIDADGLADLFVTNFAEESNRLYQGVGKCFFTDGTVRSGLGLGSRPLVGWGTGFFDAGCDGKLDCLVANGHIYPNAEAWLPGRTYRQRNLVYSFDGQRFLERGGELGAALRRPGAYRGVAFADYDLDGDVDIVLIELDAGPLLLRADAPRGNWLEIDLERLGAGGREAIGAKVEIETRSGRQTRWRSGGGSYLSANESRLHFGLGADDRVQKLTVTWPGGSKTVLQDVPANQRLKIQP